MDLFYTPTSPYARKARIVVRELNLLPQVTERVATPYADDPDLLALNPAGLVPTLSTDEGLALRDSPLICHYLCDSVASPALLPADGEQRWQVLNVEALANAVLDFGVSAVMEQRHADAAPSTAFVQRKLGKIARCVAHFPVQPDSAMDTPDLSQIAMACALTYLDFRFPDFDWRAQRPDLAPWHAAIESRPAFQATQPVEPAT